MRAQILKNKKAQFFLSLSLSRFVLINLIRNRSSKYKKKRGVNERGRERGGDLLCFIFLIYKYINLK